MVDQLKTRRQFVNLAGASAAGIVIAEAGVAVAGDEKGKEKQDEEVSPAEDLMREHGVLKRILLVYGEAIRRLDGNQELPPDPILDAAKMVRSFVEDYHEKLEEDFLFPRFRKSNTLMDLVETLSTQHQGGRKLTDITMRLTTLRSIRDGDEKRKLRDSLAQFIRMYNPHEAREDTVLFPAFRKIVSKSEYDALGEDFEKKEHELFGEEGFEKMVDHVAGIERALGIYDLAQFTPRV